MPRLLKPFEYHEPISLQEALEALDRYRNEAKVLAGGTDVLVSIKRERINPKYVVYIKSIPDLNYIDYSQQDGLKIGALATHQAVANSPLVREDYALLATACNKVGTPQVRNVGTIGGNICMAGPSQDTIPPLLALEAKLKLVSLNGERILPIDKFFIAPFQTALNETELLTEIQIPTLPPRSASGYLWRTKITAVDETMVGVAVLMTLDPTGGLCQDIRIGLCSVAPTPMRARQAEAVLKGKKIDDRLVEQAAQVAATETRPRSRADYRRRMTTILVKQAINEVWQKLK